MIQGLGLNAEGLGFRVAIAAAASLAFYKAGAQPPSEA